MAKKILKIDPDLTLTLAYCANEAYYPDRHAPPAGYTYCGKWTGKNPSVFGGSVEDYGMVFQNDKTNDEFIFAFRGIASFIDAYEDLFINKVLFTPHNRTNAKDQKVMVESGFMSIYSTEVTAGKNDSMQNQLFDLLSKLKPKKLIITGHSLGSALAQLFTLDLYASKPPYPLAIQHYNFASPRVGNAAFAKVYRQYEQNKPSENRTVRVVNYWDFIPCVPMEFLGYEHGPDYFLISFHKFPKRPLIPDVGLRHSIYNYWQVLKLAMNTPQQKYEGKVTGVDGVKLWSAIAKDDLTECHEALAEEYKRLTSG